MLYANILTLRILNNFNIEHFKLCSTIVDNLNRYLGTTWSSWWVQLLQIDRCSSGLYLRTGYASRLYPAGYFRSTKSTELDTTSLSGEKKTDDADKSVARVVERRNVGSVRVNTRGHARSNYTSACKYNEPCVSLWFMPRPTCSVSRHHLPCSAGCKFAMSRPEIRTKTTVTSFTPNWELYVDTGIEGVSGSFSIDRISSFY